MNNHTRYRGRAHVRVEVLWILGFALAILGSWVNVAHAQGAGQITFTAQNTTGNGSVTPVLTWTTTPAATSCVASGSWTGTKAASGTQTLPAITQSATYNLACTWPNSTLTVSWTPATTNTDTTAYTDAKAVRVYWNVEGSTTAPSSRDVLVPATSTTLGALPPASYVVTASSVNQLNVESVKTNPVAVTLSSASATKSIGITVNPIPMPPTNIKVE